MNATQFWQWGLSKNRQPQNEPYIEPEPFEMRPFHLFMYNTTESEQFYLRGDSPPNFNPNEIVTAQFIEVFIDIPYSFDIVEQQGEMVVSGEQNFWVMVESSPTTYGFKINPSSGSRFILKLPETLTITNIFGAIGVIETTAYPDPLFSPYIFVRITGNLLQSVHFLTTAP
ncbi:hypothetical protein [Capnocytophaga canis]|uniref:hypothetical protein n=1 Tax=Capnocytophaga canis TaxID=1848903 RepID=UPI001562C924|nr:hypothetical protein [Capnocytophaga canis]